MGNSMSYELYYNLQHQGTGRYLSGDDKGGVVTGTDPSGLYVSWLSSLTTWQRYEKTGLITAGQPHEQYLTTDTNGSVYSRESPYEDADWDQWSDYPYPTELEQALHDLVHTTKYDSFNGGPAWPEDGYTGEMKEAYDLIVDILATHDLKPPKDGEGRNISGVLKDTRHPKPGSRLYVSAEAVYEHLAFEVAYFQTLKEWYGDSGNMSALFQKTITQQQIILAADQLSTSQQRFRR